MGAATVVAGFLGVGFAVTSMLHAWYALHVYDGVNFGLPFSARLRRGRPVRDAYVGAVVVGLLAFAATWVYFALAPSLGSLSIESLLQVRLPGLVVGAGVLLLASQVLAGASWSKFVLDSATLFMAGMLVVSYVQPPSFWNLFTVYATIIPPLGGAWSVWRDAFVARRVADDADAVLYPHFPSFTYFLGSSAYTLVGSLLLIVRNVQ
jgi:hypothetical protein